MNKHFVKSVAAAALSIASLLGGIGGVGSASAAVVSGSWDPAFNDPNGNLANLGWVSTLNFYVPDTCLDSTPGPGLRINILGRTFGCSTNPLEPTFPGISLLRAQVGIYDVPSGRILDVLTWGQGTSNPTPELFSTVIGANGDITYFLGLTPSTSLRGGVARDQNFQFRFLLNGSAPTLQYAPYSPQRPATYTTAPAADLNFFRLDPAATLALAQTSVALPQTRLSVGQSVIPEPGSTALVLLALGCLALVTRRGRKASHVSPV